MHDVGALVEYLHVGLQDVEVEGRCQQAAVSAPLVTFAEQQPISWAQKTKVRGLSYYFLTLQETLCPTLSSLKPQPQPTQSHTHPAKVSGSHRKDHPWGQWQLWRETRQ